MKTLKLFLTLVFVFVANAIYADATVTSPALSSSGGGTAMIVVGGSNGTWMWSSDGSTANIANLSDVVGTRMTVLLAQPSGSATKGSQCTLTVPTGATASVTYSVSMVGTTGLVYATVGGTTHYGVGNSNVSGSVTLTPGTYTLKAYAYVGSNGGGTVVQVSTQINYQ